MTCCGAFGSPHELVSCCKAISRSAVTAEVAGSGPVVSAIPTCQFLELNAPLFRKYTLTRIYPVRYIQRVESGFEIIAEPNRRAILSLLAMSEQSVGEIERRLRMPQPMVSKHLRVLRDAGFVEATVDAQRRLYRLKPEPLQEFDSWLAQFRRFWSAHVDALERHLDRMDQDRTHKDRIDRPQNRLSTPTKTKTKNKTRPKPRSR